MPTIDICFAFRNVIPRRKFLSLIFTQDFTKTIYKIWNIKELCVPTSDNIRTIVRPQHQKLFTNSPFVFAFNINFIALHFIVTTTEHIGFAVDVSDCNCGDRFVRQIRIRKSVFRTNLNIYDSDRNFILIPINHRRMLVCNECIFVPGITIDFRCARNAVILLKEFSRFVDTVETFFRQVQSIKGFVGALIFLGRKIQ